MARIIQYPHYLFSIETTEAHRDENGNWIEEQTNHVFKGKCREETNGKGSQIQLAGGTFHVFSSLIQLPKGTDKIKEGSKVLITDDPSAEEVRIEGEILKFDKGQLHSRLWL